MPDLERLWSDPQNWSTWGYACAEDPRVVVPKRQRWAGYTMNWAHPRAKTVVAQLLVLGTAPGLLMFVLFGLFGPLGLCAGGLLFGVATIVMVRRLARLARGEG